MNDAVWLLMLQGCFKVESFGSHTCHVEEANRPHRGCRSSKGLQRIFIRTHSRTSHNTDICANAPAKQIAKNRPSDL